MSQPKKRILVELRAALDGHSGIPQAARLLFRNLARMPDFEVQGLIQHGGHVLAAGLPDPIDGSFVGANVAESVHQLGKVIIAIEERPWLVNVQGFMHSLLMVIRQLIGGTQKLGYFDASRFPDFVWRRLFAKSLPADDLALVVSQKYRVQRMPWHALHITGLVTRWLGGAFYGRVDTRGIDVLIAETPYPGRLSRGTTLVIRYHDSIPLLMPHTIKERRYHQAAHFHALKRNVADGAWFMCVSETTRQDLIGLFPEVASRAVTVPNTVSHHYYNEDSRIEWVGDVIRTRMSRRMQRIRSNAIASILSGGVDSQQVEYLLCVSTVEPRKNHLALLAAWERLRSDGFPHLKLVLVGELGWYHQRITRAFEPWMARGELLHLENVPAGELRLLYKHAKATVCPSVGEGFGYSGVEAMMSGGVVVASDIPVHREIYGEAAIYANPYDVENLAGAIKSVMRPEGESRRAERVELGAVQSQRYEVANIAPQYHDFLARLPTRLADHG